ncbi:MAG: hypothetical protein ABJA66_19875 [Actinomycetota bacterium]
MNGEIQMLNTGVVIFPLKKPDEEISEVEIVENQVVEVSTVATQTVNKETRFARLKRSLRKRSAGIL